MLRRPLIWLVMLATCLVQASCIGSAWKNVRGGAADFAPLFGTALAVARGEKLSYDPTLIHGVDVGLDESHWRPMEHPESQQDRLHPPFEVLLFLPLTLLPYSTAYLVWTLCNLVFLWLVTILLWRFLPYLQPEFEVAAALYALSMPVVVCLMQGQDSILLLLLLTLSFVSLADGKDLRAGVFLALGLFKFHLVLPILAILFIERNWSAVRGFLYGFTGLLTLTCAVVGVRNTLAYVPFVLQVGNHISANGSTRTFMMPNIRGLVALINGPYVHIQFQALLVILLSLVAFCITAIWALKFRDEPIAIRFSCIVVTASLISYHYYIYNATILALPILLVANEMGGRECSRLFRGSYALLLTLLCFTAVCGLFFYSTALPLLGAETLVLFCLILAIPYKTREPASQDGVRSPAKAAVAAGI